MRTLLPACLLLMGTAAQAGDPVLQPFSARRESGPVVVDTEMISSARDAGASSRDGIEGRVAGSLRLNESLRLGIGASVVHNTESREDEIGNLLELTWLPEDTGLNSGLGFKRDYEGQLVPYTRFGWDSEALGRPFASAFIVELPQSAGRDDWDLAVSAAYNLYADHQAHWNLEAAAEDLETLWGQPNAEGGTRVLLGPSLDWRLSEMHGLRVFVGWMHAVNTRPATREGFPADGDSGSRLVARVRLSYDKLRY